MQKNRNVVHGELAFFANDMFCLSEKTSRRVIRKNTLPVAPGIQNQPLSDASPGKATEAANQLSNRPANMFTATNG